MFEGLRYPTGPFSISELERAKSKILERKAAGPYNISPEVIKRCDMAPVVQSLDSAIHRINHYPADKHYGNQLRYPLDSDLSCG